MGPGGLRLPEGGAFHLPRQEAAGGVVHSHGDDYALLPDAVPHRGVWDELPGQGGAAGDPRLGLPLGAERLLAVLGHRPHGYREPFRVLALLAWLVLASSLFSSSPYDVLTAI